MKRCLTIITICVFSLFLGGCTLFPSVLRGMEALAVVQALGADREGDGVRLSMVTAADSSRGEGPVRMRRSPRRRRTRPRTRRRKRSSARTRATSCSARRARART